MATNSSVSTPVLTRYAIWKSIRTRPQILAYAETLETAIRKANLLVLREKTPIAVVSIRGVVHYTISPKG